MIFSRNHFIWLVISLSIAIPLLISISGCTSCEDDILANTNNGNDDPEVLIIDAWGADVGAFLYLLRIFKF